MASEYVFTVTKLNEYADAILRNDPRLRSIKVSGEISGFKRYPSGHLYFSLNDGDSLVSCVMFRSYAAHLKFEPSNGMKVILHGEVHVYGRDGRVQVIADSMQEEGIGDQFVKLLLLKERLEKEGVFANKRALPALPRCIGVATSGSGAALRDIVKVIKSRFPTMNILVSPCLVQGKAASQSICEAVNALQEFEDCDVIIVGRGGGAYEDLNAFNDESVARTIFASRVPVVSAVGHEIDFTLADFAADVRAITPTEAGVLCCPEYDAMLDSIRLERERAFDLVKDALNNAGNDLKKVKGSAAMVSPRHSIELKRERLKHAVSGLESSMRSVLSNAAAKYEAAAEKFRALDPDRVISRGYAMVTDENGRIVKSVSGLNKDDKIRLKMSGGTASAIITNTDG